MRKLFVTFIAIIAAAAFANGQLYLGGSVGIHTTGGNSKSSAGLETIGEKTFDIEIAPRIGYHFNDKFSLGASLNFDYGKMTSEEPNPEWHSTTMFTVSPYVRYAFLTFGKFHVNIEAGLGFGFGSYKEKDMPSNIKVSGFNFNLYAVPVLTYDLSKHFTLETKLNFCGLNYFSRTITVKSGDEKATENVNGFDLGVDTNNVISSGGIEYNETEDIINSAILTIGFTYKF